MSSDASVSPTRKTHQSPTQPPRVRSNPCPSPLVVLVARRAAKRILLPRLVEPPPVVRRRSLGRAFFGRVQPRNHLCLSFRVEPPRLVQCLLLLPRPLVSTIRLPPLPAPPSSIPARSLIVRRRMERTLLGAVAEPSAPTRPCHPRALERHRALHPRVRVLPFAKYEPVRADGVTVGFVPPPHVGDFRPGHARGLPRQLVQRERGGRPVAGRTRRARRSGARPRSPP